MAFKLASQDTEFNCRVDKLFDTLAAVSTDLKLDTFHSENSTEKLAVLKRKSDSLNSREIDDDDDNFVKPFPVQRKKYSKAFSQAQILRIERFKKDVPGYVKDPKQWTCYSLKDTKCQNDSENAEIASELLSSLHESSSLPYEGHDNDENDSDKKTSTQKIQFKKPLKLLEEASSVDEAENLKNPKHFTMPSYEFGQVKKCKPKKTSPKSTESSPKKSKEISLTYLLEEECDVED